MAIFFSGGSGFDGWLTRQIDRTDLLTERDLLKEQLRQSLKQVAIVNKYELNNNNGYINSNNINNNNSNNTYDKFNI